MEVVKQYNLVARCLHWLSAMAVLGLFGLGWWMVELDYYSPWYQDAPTIHRSVGILLAGVTVLRLVWNQVSQKPAVEGRPFERKAAISAHHLMYVLLFGLFITGYLISTEKGQGIEVFNWFTVPALGELFDGQADLSGTIHYYCAYSLIGLVVIHAGAAIKHHVIDKDNTLRKMTTGVKS